MAGSGHHPPTAVQRVRRRRAAGVTAVVAVLLGGLVAAFSAAPVSAATVDTSAWYVLVNRNSGKALDVYNLATNDGARITQWTRNDGNQQQWQFVDSGDGYYRLKSRLSGKVLDVYNFSTADGAGIVQWSDANGTNQQFRLADSDGGHVRLINRNSNKAVEVQGASTADGGNVVQYSDWGGANQQWQLVRVGGTGPTTTTTTPPGTCALPSTYRWTSTGPLAQPKPGWVSLRKDCSAGGTVFASSVSSSGPGLPPVLASAAPAGGSSGRATFAIVNPWPGSTMFQPKSPLVNLANSIEFSTTPSLPIRVASPSFFSALSETTDSGPSTKTGVSGWRLITSMPGRSQRWKVLPRMICAPMPSISRGSIPFTVP